MGPRFGISCSASNAESVRPKAADRRPSRAAVGLTSARSILEIIALETAARSARSSRDQRRAVRSPRTRAATVESTESTIVDICPLYESGRRSSRVLVIASEAIAIQPLSLLRGRTGLLRRCGPRNDENGHSALIPIRRIGRILPLRLEQPQHCRPFENAVGPARAGLIEMRGVRQHVLARHGE